MFHNLFNWAVDSQNQNVHCKPVFVVVAMAVAVEILVAAKNGTACSIGISGFLLAPLTALEAFLKEMLPVFLEALGPFLGFDEERIASLCRSDLMRGAGLNKYGWGFGKAVVVVFYSEGYFSQVCRCVGPLQLLASKLRHTLCLEPGDGGGQPCGKAYMRSKVLLFV